MRDERKGIAHHGGTDLGVAPRNPSSSRHVYAFVGADDCSHGP
jgi:hypothetical protein